MTNPISESRVDTSPGSAYAEDLALALELADRADGITPVSYTHLRAHET